MTHSIPTPLLVLEAATSAGSVALVIEGRVVARADVATGAARDDAFFPAVQQLLRDARLDARSLAGIVCGGGPGSFTSLRIAASLAKGIAFAAECPLYAVSSLVLAAATMDRPGAYLVHADALRGDRYTLAVDIDASGVARGRGVVSRVPFASLNDVADGRQRLAVLMSPEPLAEFRIVRADAAAVVRCDAWLSDGPVSLDAWEPSYGRLAEAQVKWEVAHGRALSDA